MDYDIKPLGKVCAVTGQPLRPGDHVFSVLIDDDGEIQRLDFSEKGWPGSPPPNSIGVWRVVVPAPVIASRNPLDPTALMQLFEQLCENEQPLQERLRYVLALLLMRMRRLKLDGRREIAGEAFLQFSASNGEGNFEVRDLQLSDQEAHSTQQELNALLLAESSSLPNAA
jgi:hypothetical protein